MIFTPASEPVASSAAVSASAGGETLLNAFSVDVEDYFQVGAFERIIARSEWDRLPSRVDANTRRLLELLDRHGVRATFFVLGWVAERWPGLVRDIVAAGHELGAHGQDHRRLQALGPRAFGEEIRRVKGTLEDLAGVAILGFRAPTFSLVRETLWAVDILAAAGFRYDSSIFPIVHDRYGIPDSPRFPYTLQGGIGGSLKEFPLSTLRVTGINLPFAGGGYLRHFPFFFIRRATRHVNRVEGQPVIFYVHPWEIDPDQPRQPAGPLTRFRHYRNLKKTADRLRALFREFRFIPVREVLGL